jgi:uncharacterized membrane protein (UPF0136 family)
MGLRVRLVYLSGCELFLCSLGHVVANFKAMSQSTILWIYIVLLLVGGLIGFLKAGSKVSLIASAVSAALLIIASIPGLFQPGIRQILVDTILALLLVIFAVRLTKTKKFMPSGLMLILTLATLAVRHLFR